MNKNELPTEIVTERTIIRRAGPADLPKIAAWPEYGPGDGMNMTRTVRDSGKQYWWERIDHPDRCHYSVVRCDSGEIIGVYAFVWIDWDKATVGNMGVRIRADLCGQGYGSETLPQLLTAGLESGMGSIRLDVAPLNEGAIQFYKKCGMQMLDEYLWREHKGDPIDPGDPRWKPLLPYLRREGDRWMVRFYWMEISCAADQE